MSRFLPQTLDGLLNAVTWTPIAPAGAWDHVVVSNQGASTLRLRTDAADPSTEVVIPTGTERVIVATPPRVNTRQGATQVNYRFPAGAVAFALKTDSGTGTGMSLLWA